MRGGKKSRVCLGESCATEASVKEGRRKTKTRCDGEERRYRMMMLDERDESEEKNKQAW